MSFSFQLLKIEFNLYESKGFNLLSFDIEWHELSNTNKVLEIGYSGNTFIEEPNKKVFSVLGLSNKISDETKDAINNEIKKSKAFFAVSEN